MEKSDSGRAHSCFHRESENHHLFGLAPRNKLVPILPGSLGDDRAQENSSRAEDFSALVVARVDSDGPGKCSHTLRPVGLSRGSSQSSCAFYSSPGIPTFGLFVSLLSLPRLKIAASQRLNCSNKPRKRQSAAKRRCSQSSNAAS